jgi:hypothetical protein
LNKKSKLAMDLEIKNNREALKRNHQANVYTFLEPNRKRQKVDIEHGTCSRYPASSQ